MVETPSKLDFRSPEWVAEQLQIDRQTVYKYLQEGALPGLQLGRKWLVSESRLVEFLFETEHAQTEARRLALQVGLRVAVAPGLFTEDGRAALRRAIDEAQRLEHSYVGQEHLLLSFAAEPECAAAQLLLRLEVDANGLRSAVERVIGRGEASPEVPPAFAPRASRVVELAIEEVPHGGADSQHLLLGILIEGTGVGAAILEGLGLTLELARRAVEPRTAGDGPNDQ